MTGVIEVITEAGYHVHIGPSFTHVTHKEKGGKKFVGPGHRQKAVEYVIERMR
jgi:hypothetical protein